MVLNPIVFETVLIIPVRTSIAPPAAPKSGKSTAFATSGQDNGFAASIVPFEKLTCTMLS